MFRHIILFFVFVIKLHTCIAQDIEIANLSFFLSKDGLSNYNIHKIIQDKKKFLWIATQDGLNRFDGREFIGFNKDLEKKKALWSNDIRDLVYESSRNLLWVICNYGGINAIDVTTCCVKYSIPYNNGYLETDWRTSARFSNNKIFIGTSGGIDIFNTMSFTFESIDNTLFSSKFDATKNDIRTIDVDSKGNLWIGILDKGILILDPFRYQIIKEIKSASIASTLEDKKFWPTSGSFSNDKSYYLATTGGLLKFKYDDQYHISKSTLHNTPLKVFIKQDISNICINKKGDLIISATKLFRYSKSEKKLSKIVPSDIEDARWLNNITFCYEDIESNLWVGCKQGLGAIKSNRSPFLPTKNSSYFNYKLSHIYAICPVNANQQLIGTNEGLFLLTMHRKLKQLLKDHLVQNIFKLTKNLFVISGAGSIKVYCNGKLFPIQTKFPEFWRYRNWQLNSNGTLNDSILVLGTETNDGVLVWNLKKHTIENIRQTVSKRTFSLFSNNVNSVFVNKIKQAIVLSDYGITIIDYNNSSTKSIVIKDELNHKPIGIFMEMTETSNNYWINVYGEGLIKLDKNFNLLKVFSKNEGLSNTGLYKMFNYKDSLLVLTSNYGISVFNLATEQFKKYFEEDGLQNNTFEEACGDRLDRFFYAGGVNGFVEIRPANFQTSTACPILYFSRLKVQSSTGEIVDTSNLNISSFSIPNNAIQTSITFSAIYYNNPLKVQYAFRIKENGEGWTNINAQNFITLTGLGPGTYTIQLRAANEDGAWSEVKEFKLVYLPKWYQTLWFEAVIGLFLIAIIYLSYSMRINQLKNEQKIKSRLATDLHDDLGSTLNSIKVYSNLRDFSNVNVSTKQAIDDLRDIIWVMDDKKGTVLHLVSRIRRFVEPLCNACGITFTKDIPIDAMNYKLKPQEKKNLYMIIKEAINNAVKYSDAAEIKLSVRVVLGKLKVTVTDNGKGFDASLAKEGNGLNNMKVRASDIHYSIKILSAKGTEVHLEKK